MTCKYLCTNFMYLCIQSHVKVSWTEKQVENFNKPCSKALWSGDVSLLGEHWPTRRCGHPGHNRGPVKKKPLLALQQKKKKPRLCKSYRNQKKILSKSTNSFLRLLSSSPCRTTRSSYSICRMHPGYTELIQLENAYVPNTR